MEIKFLNKRVEELGFAPATEHSAGYDLRAAVDLPVLLNNGETHLIPTGVAVHMQSGAPNTIMGGQDVPCAVIMPRSGLGCKGIKPANAPGLIDADYQGEIMICLENNSGGPIQVNPMDRIAQLVFMTAHQPLLATVTEFGETTKRGKGGLGSTGKK